MCTDLGRERSCWFFFARNLVHHVTSRQLEHLALAQYILKMQGGKEHFSNFEREDGEQFVCRGAKIYIKSIFSDHYRYF